MKISTIEAIALRPLAMRAPFATTNVAIDALHFVIVKIITDVGIVGYGEALAAWEVTGETSASVIGCIALYQDERRLPKGCLLRGVAIDTLAKVKAAAARMSPTDRPDSVSGNPSAKAAIEQAMLDCCAQFNGMSIYALLGIEERPVPAAAVCGLLPVEDTLKWVADSLERDPVLLKLKVGGAGGFDRDVEIVNQAAAMIRDSGKPIMLGADANQGFFDAPGTIAFCKQIAGSLDWLEQPFCAHDLTAFSRVRSQCDTPLMADESLHSLADAKLLHKLGGVDCFNVKTMKTGGVLPAMEIIDFAFENDILCYLGSMIETSLGCLMGCVAANYAPQSIMASDLSSFTHVADEPWKLLRLDGSQVVGTGLKPDPESAGEILQRLRLPPNKPLVVSNGTENQ